MNAVTKPVPKLRFPEFTNDWQKKKVEKVLSIGSGRDYKYLGDGDIPVYGTGGLMTHVDDYLYEGKSIGIGRKGTIDRPQFLTGKFWTVDTLFYTYGYKDVVPEFMYAVFQRINWQRWNEASGVPSLSKKTIENIKISIPSVKEQQKIADFLTTVDKKIELLEKRLELLKQYKKGVMQKIFTQQIRFKDKDGKSYPDWVTRSFKESGLIYTGLVGKSSVDFDSSFDSSFITYMQIFSNSRIDINEFGKVNIRQGEKQNQVKKGDIFFTVSSETSKEAGYASALLDEVNDVYLNSFCFGYRLNPELLSPEFARFFFHSKGVRSMIIRLAQGSTRFNLSKKAFLNISIQFPSIREQQRISAYLTSLDDCVGMVDETIGRVKVLKKSLLQGLLV